MTDTPGEDKLIITSAQDPDTGKSVLVTNDGQTLYYYVPMKDDPEHQRIPWGYRWRSDNRGWAFQWPPLKKSGPLSGEGGVNTADLGAFDRYQAGDKNDMRGYVQVTYKGWWLYTFVGDDEKTFRGKVPGVWETVPVDIDPLRDSDKDDGTEGDPQLTGGP